MLVPPEKLTDAALADEIGDLSETAALYEIETGDRLKAVKKELLLRKDGEPADQKVVVKGKRFLVELGEKKWERTPTPKLLPALRRKLKLTIDSFLERFCTTSLKNVDANFSEEEQAGLVTKERSGSRSIKAVPL